MPPVEPEEEVELLKRRISLLEEEIESARERLKDLQTQAEKEE